MSSTKELPSTDQIYLAVKTVADALGNTKYAIIGGGACIVLGSDRQTSDVDFVVPKGQTIAARNLLKQDQEHFVVDKRTRHTMFKCTPPVEVEILTPPILFKEEFTESTPVLNVDGIKVLKPTLLLNTKCASILERSDKDKDKDKRATDAEDIRFILRWCAKHRMRLTTAEVPNATQKFVMSYINTYGSDHLWRAAGYNVEKGMI